MKQYVMAYCVYDPNNYFGHRLKSIQAESFEEAEKKGWEFLEALFGKGKWEYVIMENQSPYCLYDTLKHRRL